MHLDSIVFKGLRKVNFGDVFQFLREKNRCKKEGKGNGFWCALIFCVCFIIIGVMNLTKVRVMQKLSFLCHTRIIG